MSLRLIVQQLGRMSVSGGGRVGGLHTSAALAKDDDRRQMKASMPAKDEGTLGERTANIDAILSK